MSISFGLLRRPHLQRGGELPDLELRAAGFVVRHLDAVLLGPHLHRRQVPKHLRVRPGRSVVRQLDDVLFGPHLLGFPVRLSTVVPRCRTGVLNDERLLPRLNVPTFWYGLRAR